MRRLPYALTTGGRAAAAYVKGTSTLTHAEEVDEQNAIWQSVESELSDPKPKARSKIASMLRMEGEYRLGKRAVGAGCEDETN